MNKQNAFSLTLYRAKKGDTYQGIAERYGLNLCQLTAINKNTAIFEGGMLLLPEPPKREHMVRPGETFAGIAEKYGVSESELMQVNGLKTLFTGLRLTVPG